MVRALGQQFQEIIQMLLVLWFTSHEVRVGHLPPSQVVLIIDLLDWRDAEFTSNTEFQHSGGGRRGAGDSGLRPKGLVMRLLRYLTLLLLNLGLRFLPLPITKIGTASRYWPVMGRELVNPLVPLGELGLGSSLDGCTERLA